MSDLRWSYDSSSDYRLCPRCKGGWLAALTDSTCHPCGGHGYIPVNTAICGTCHGEGVVHIPTRHMSVGTHGGVGASWISNDEVECRRCGGTGLLTLSRFNPLVAIRRTRHWLTH